MLVLGKMDYYQNPSPASSPHLALYFGKLDAGIVIKKDATNTNAPSHLTKLDLIKMSWLGWKKIIQVQI